MKTLKIFLCISLVACSSTSLRREEVLINAKIPTAKNENHDFFKEYCKEGRQISAVGAQAIIHLPEPSKGMMIDEAAKLREQYISRSKSRLKELFFQSSLEKPYYSRNNSFAVIDEGKSKDLFKDSRFFMKSEAEQRPSRNIAIFEDGVFHIGSSFPSVFKINHKNLEHQGSSSYLEGYVYVIDRKHETISTVFNYLDLEPNVDYGEVWVRKSKEVKVLPMYPAHLDFMKFFREKYALKFPIKLRKRFGMPKRYDLSGLLYSSDRDWELYLRAVTSYKQSVSEDGTHLNYIVGIDLNPFCKYGIQKDGFLVK